MKTKELMMLGVTQEAAIKAAHSCVGNALASGMKQNEVKLKVKSIIADPNTYIADTTFSEFANAMIIANQSAKAYVYRDEPAPLNQWGIDLEESALTQIHNACKLPVSVAAALMPDDMAFPSEAYWLQIMR
ncbi:MAG: hypothetical protein BWY69_00013 [Planctomycetes bacterium ADurb.Bin401]|nr:MAG: hypothetical protein BWY69_00013 [Planctomycetes bacterium ADurb.Bin401]